MFLKKLAKKIKEQEMAKKIKARRQTRNKVIVFSTISAAFSGIAAWFFSDEKNRKMVVKKSQEAGEQIKKVSTEGVEKAKKESASLLSKIKGIKSKITKKSAKTEEKSVDDASLEPDNFEIKID